jgi:uncharacterized repeat protein (TIGR03803 family)
VAFGSPYAVTVQTQPNGYVCSLANASGTMGPAPVTNVTVTCSIITYTVGGTITGLAKNGLTLSNGTDHLVVLANATTFTMTMGVANGGTYNITVTTHPVAVQCTVTNSSGTIAGADVSNVVVNCGAGVVSPSYSFGALPDGQNPYADLIVGSDGNFYGTTIDGGATNNGAVFKLTPDGTETIIHSFDYAVDGGYPLADLYQDGSGNFFGTTYEGGPFSNGVLFKITPNGTYSILHAFGAPGDASEPYGNVTLASDGNFYATTYSGGANNQGAVFRIAPDGSNYAVIYSFAAGTDGAGPAGSLLLANDGKLYGTTTGGGAYNLGTVFSITLSGTESVLYSFGSGTDGATPYGNVIQATDGNLYGLTYRGGANNGGAAFKLALDGTETLLHSFGSGTDGWNPNGSLIQASDGNLYGMTYEGGANFAGIIFELATDGTETVLYSFAAEYPFGSLIETSNHDLFGLGYDGGTNNFGVVFFLN